MGQEQQPQDEEEEKWVVEAEVEVEKFHEAAANEQRSGDRKHSAAAAVAVHGRRPDCRSADGGSARFDFRRAPSGFRSCSMMVPVRR